jgi:TPR repeat protein
VADFQKGKDAYEAGDYAAALRELRPLAEQEGDTKAMFILSCMYAEGEGVAQDYVLAYTFSDIRLKLTTAQEEEESWWPDGERSLRRKQLAEVAAMMTPGQVAEAQWIALALINRDRIPLQQWMEKHHK